MSLIPPQQGWNPWSHYSLTFLPVLVGMERGGVFTSFTGEAVLSTIEFLEAALTAQDSDPDHLYKVTERDEEALRILKLAVCRGEWLLAATERLTELTPEAAAYLEPVVSGDVSPFLLEYMIPTPPEVELVRAVSTKQLPALITALREAHTTETFEHLTEREFALVQALVTALKVTAESHPPVDFRRNLAA